MKTKGLVAIAVSVAVVAGIAAALAPRRDPLEPFIVRATHVQVNLDEQNGSHLRRLFMRIDTMTLDDARPILRERYTPQAGWRLVKDNEFRIVYSRGQKPLQEFVRAVRVLQRPGISVEEERYLARHEALAYELRKLTERA